MFKKALCLIFAFLLSIESFAAVVSDNDGSAFITKAEFDSLKNNFQNIIDSYNSSIDSKIDTAISSYLAGIKTEVITSFTPFVLVNVSTPKIIGRKSDYGNITQQFYNEISGTATTFGMGGGTPAQWVPYTWYPPSHASYPSSNGRTEWTWNVSPFESLKSYGSGYEFDENGNIINIYGDDNIIISMTWTDICDTAYMDSVIGKPWNGTPWGNDDPTNNLKIDQMYSNALVHNTNLMCRNLNATSPNVYPPRKWDTEILANYNSWLMSSGSAGSAWLDGLLNRPYINLCNTFYATHRQENKETDISIYNKVDAKIYAYQKNTKYLEWFDDIVDNSSLTSVERRFQLMTLKSNNANDFIPPVIGKYLWDTNPNSRHQFIYTMPKLKIANITTKDAYKPNVKASTDIRNKFNNLNQFQNGYMKYKLSAGDVSPKFYGGVPLFNLDKDTNKVKFKIKVEATTSGTSKIRLWVKSYEFPNEFCDFASTAWNATNVQSGKKYVDEVVIVTSNKNTTNTNKYIDIELNEETEITISEPEKNIPYFLRFSEINNSSVVTNEGGKITMLYDFTSYASVE